MAAQYRPYRDEDSVDGLETTSWTDNEPGTLQIYEKTTEELPFNSATKKAFWIQIALFILTGSVCFLFGYLGPFHHKPSDLANQEPRLGTTKCGLDSIEDSTIKDKLSTLINSKSILAVLKKYQDTNRTPGSASDHEFAQYINELLLGEYGLDRVTSLNHTFKTMLPRRPSVIKLLNKENGELYSTLEHESYAFDDMRPFLPLSQAGEDVIETNQLLYLNKGSKDDYTRLPSLGVSVNETEGKVLVIRQTYYQAHDVIITAQESGAKAIILFPDPETYGKQSPFPKSLQLADEVARAHPLAWSHYGDLVSLNLTSLNGMDVSKLGLDKESKVQIPVLLVSFKTAEKILRGLSGAQAPKEWNCFDFTLYLGPGYKEDNNIDQRDKIRIEFFNHETELTTTLVTGVIEGAIEPDRYIVIGSRRDSLNRGLIDSVSGTATMLEIARVYSNLVKDGWRPRRTIIFSSFGAESFNLIGSSRWLEIHQRLLHSRAVAYINCDLVVTGNRTATIAASPLLYQVLYNATKQVMNPDRSDDQSHLRTVYDVWKWNHSINKSDNTLLTASDPELVNMIEKTLKSSNGQGNKQNLTSDDDDDHEDSLGHQGSYLRLYRKSASVKMRPRVRRLDLHSIYSPFFLYAGIPVADVRYSGFQQTDKSASTGAALLEDTLPLIGTKYDNMAALQQIDPQLKYHTTVAQILSEMLRDLSDSVFLPFNLLDYAVTLRDSYLHFVMHYGKMLTQSSLELENLKQVIHEFAIAAAKFHQRQDRVRPSESLKVRKFNDQMMLLERAFLDPSGLPNHWERKHIILAPNDGQDRREGFPGLVDWITLMDGESLEGSDYTLYIEILKVHYNAIVYTISNAIKVIEEVDMI